MAVRAGTSPASQVLAETMCGEKTPSDAAALLPLSGAPPGEQRSPGCDPRATSTSTLQTDDKGKRTTGHGQDASRRAEPINVWAAGYYTVGTRGRVALTMVVLSCVFCGRAHRHNGKPDFISGKRTASCGRGSYRVHLGTIAGEVAA